MKHTKNFWCMRVPFHILVPTFALSHACPYINMSAWHGRGNQPRPWQCSTRYTTRIHDCEPQNHEPHSNASFRQAYIGHMHHHKKVKATTTSSLSPWVSAHERCTKLNMFHGRQKKDAYAICFQTPPHGVRNTCMRTEDYAEHSRHSQVRTTSL